MSEQEKRKTGSRTGGAEVPRKRKKRRKRKSSRLVYVVGVVLAAVILALVAWTAANDVLALNKDFKTAVITVEEGESLSSVASKLKAEGIIENKALFMAFGSISDAQEKISQGTYEMNTNYDYRAIVSAMGKNSGSRMIAEVTIPEGYTVEQTLLLLEEKKINNYKNLAEAAANYEFDYDFLAGLPYGDANRLEGYLFPDTYEFYMGEAPEKALNRLLSNFNKKMNADLMAQVEASPYTLHEIINIASMIEKETDGDDERTIASVIYNRLSPSNTQTAGFLQIDATVQYALPERKEELTHEDTKIDSPYNTYVYKGLPVGPIANPGLDAIKAALAPEDTNYYFYALGNDGKHHFTTNYRDHVNFVNSQG